MSKYKRIKKYTYGGMSYAPNVITPGLSATTNTLFEEVDPQLQEARMLGFENEVTRLKNESKSRADNIELEKEKNKLLVEQEGAKTDAKFDTGFSAVSKIAQAANTASPQLFSTGSVGATGSNMAKATRLARRAKGATGARAARLTRRSQQAARMGKSGAAAGSGLKQFATSGTGMGMIADFAGQGIRALSDDDDATKWNAGEVTGDLLSTAGKGAQLGTMVGGPVGTLVGAGLGLAYGTIKGLTSRNRARREEQKRKNELARDTRIGNVEAVENYSGQRSRARLGELKTKTYSGYDLGRNTVAKYGGLKKYI